MGSDSFTMLEPITKIIKLALTAGARRTVNSVLILLFSSGIKILEFSLRYFSRNSRCNLQAFKVISSSVWLRFIPLLRLQVILHTVACNFQNLLFPLYKYTFEKDVLWRITHTLHCLCENRQQRRIFSLFLFKNVISISTTHFQTLTATAILHTAPPP